MRKPLGTLLASLLALVSGTLCAQQRGLKIDEPRFQIPLSAQTAGTTPGVTAGMRILRFGPGDVSGIDWLNTFDFNTADHMLRFNDGDGDEIISGVGLQVPAGTSGNLRMTFMSSVHDEPYRAGDGVGTSVFITGDDASPQFLFCDEFAPTSGALGSCSATLRAP